MVIYNVGIILTLTNILLSAVTDSRCSLNNNRQVVVDTYSLLITSNIAQYDKEMSNIETFYS